MRRVYRHLLACCCRGFHFIVNDAAREMITVDFISNRIRGLFPVLA
jgi:hypothetical protein